ncbi:barstar family protein [Streptomyces sp. ISL-22]|uniref:barstar family protein n=1 Tax=unclassified Streptomyces TaxID=2593676 RepID=UPI001BE78CF7|nr:MULTISPECIES: barstar family protein [unclassified Streptomyces]MBT2420534.1 barstar family protein [Streptomyces sp. ISL-24]MBT2437973.1 barstar family protein [Streptomyces sp. ISL-22]
MIPTVHEVGGHRAHMQYALTETGQGHVWGVCAAVEGLFGEPQRGTYELLDWVPEGAEVCGWVGSRVWLVPEGEALDPWLLEDVESPGRRSWTNSLVLTGLDDYEGPPEGHRRPVRVHDGHRWLGSCRELTRIVPPEPEPARPPLVLRGLARSDQLRAALAKGTRRALNLEEASLEIRDERGQPLAERLLWAKVSSWRPSDLGPGLIDLELDAGHLTPVPEYARPVWEQWFAGPPDTPGAWTGLDTRCRKAWLDLVRERACRGTHRDRPAGHAYELDGRHVTDEPGLYLALGEAVNGPGGYFGGCLTALDDCLRGTFGYTAPATLLWRNASTAREHLSRTLTAEGRPYDLFAGTLQVLAEGGMHVTLV